MEKQILEELMAIKHRLNDLENQPGPRPLPIPTRPPHRGKGYGRFVGNSRVFTRQPTHRPNGFNYRAPRGTRVTERAQNYNEPNDDTQILSRKLFRSVQIKHHSKNWQTIPKNLARKIDDVFNNVVPPAPSDETKQKLQELGGYCKSSLVAIMLSHLAETQTRINTELVAAPAAEPEAFDEAAYIARSKLSRHFGNKIEIAEINNWLTEDLWLIERRGQNKGEQQNPVTTPRNAEHPWAQPARPAKRRADEIISPIATSNPFEALAADPVINLDDDVEFPQPSKDKPSKKCKTTRPITPPPTENLQGSGTGTNSMEADEVATGYHSPAKTSIPPTTAIQQRQEEAEAGTPRRQPTPQASDSSESPNAERANRVAQVSEASANTGLNQPQENVTCCRNSDLETPEPAVELAEPPATDQEQDSDPHCPTQPSSSAPARLAEQPGIASIFDDILDQVASQKEGRVTIHPANPKNQWHASIQRDTDVLIIGDSNLRLTRNLPAEWEAHVFPGAYLSHAATIIDQLKPSKSLRSIVVACGINNRGWPLRDIKHDVNKVANAALKKRLPIHFVGVSISPKLLQSEHQKMDELNKMAQEKFKLAFIKPLEPHEVSVSPTDKFQIHYDQCTVDKIVSNIKKHFLRKPLRSHRLSL